MSAIARILAPPKVYWARSVDMGAGLPSGFAIDAPREKTTMLRLTSAFAAVAITLCGCTGEFPADAQRLKAAEAAYDGALLVKSLEEIEAWHIEHDTGVAASLAPGLSAASIAATLSETQCQATEELKALWSWHDGGTGPVPFVWYHDFLPLKEALSEYDRLILNPLVRWDPEYLPFLAFEGEWYAAYCGKGVTNAGPIIHYFLEDEPRVTYVNLTVFMATMAEALRSNAIRWEDGAILEDIRKLHAIHQYRNPGYNFPYHVPDDA